MNFLDPKHPQKSPFPFPFPKPPQFNLQQAFTNLQSHCSTFLHKNKLSDIPTHFESALSNLQTQAKTAIESSFASFGLQPGSVPSRKNHAGFARVAAETRGPAGSGPKPVLSVRERLAGVPVYALSNSSDEFVLVSEENTGKSLALFCFREDDAGVLLQQMKAMEPSMGEGSKVVPVGLNQIFDLKIEGVAFRFIPETSQIKHALEERRRAGLSDYSFSGIPVFQSKSLLLRREKKGYRPVFFRKEDLDITLAKAAVHQNRVNPALRGGDIEVGVLEDIIQELKSGSSTSSSSWSDVVFIPPGFEVSTDLSKPSVVPKFKNRE